MLDPCGHLLGCKAEQVIQEIKASYHPHQLDTWWDIVFRFKAYSQSCFMKYHRDRERNRVPQSNSTYASKCDCISNIRRLESSVHTMAHELEDSRLWDVYTEMSFFYENLYDQEKVWHHDLQKENTET